MLGCLHYLQNGDTDNALLERDVIISCMRPPIGLSIHGPQNVYADSEFTLDAALMDPVNEPEPVMFEWTCVEHSGVPCFGDGRHIPDAAMNQFHSKAGSLLPGEYTIKVKHIMQQLDCLLAGRCI